jgi:ubiquinone/menaquinone biosynthesis C-methylase UbiE
MCSRLAKYFDLDQGISELYRVTSPQGRVIVVTKSKYAKNELDDYLKEFLSLYSASSSNVKKGEAHFCMENAIGFLEKHFYIELITGHFKK